ncbi:YdeI/OmpD-associated family protein [Nocardioides panacisoli]|uniref:YdeI/OmpD-associated family protein n=1 Tax=Nocardioides panacisoli TaxID=627624 RepID=UPI001C626A8F|nr:YdeI/OmpD-associated family protein [Nocardioides panacisoli]QYJ02949.1 YdeI/OmpD-associated family protein [Nocardioides panacisoli]
MAADEVPGRLGGTPERPARFFAGPEEFAAWLALHHDTETELWMGLHRKHVPDRGLTWEQAVPEALCWGWIDSLVQRIDGDSRRQRWTPRKPTSQWSRVNLDLVEQLRAEGRMQPSGEAIWAQRRTDVAPYGRGDEATLPAPFAARLADSPAATAFWEAATATYRRVCTVWVTSAKQEATRERRMAQLIECCAAGELVPSQRYGDRPRWVDRAAEAAVGAAGPPPGAR